MIDVCFLDKCFPPSYSHLEQIATEAQYADDDEDKGRAAWKLGRLAQAEDGRYVPTIVKANCFPILISLLKGFSVALNIKRQVSRTVMYIVKVNIIIHYPFPRYIQFCLSIETISQMDAGKLAFVADDEIFQSTLDFIKDSDTHVKQ